MSTVVNNVETIAAVVPIINDGGEEYAKIGIGKSTGTKFISASGHIKKPGVYEIELGIPVEEFIYSDEYCGGMLNGRKLKAVVAGGSSVPILPAELILKTAKGEPRLMTYESLADGGFATGTMLGSGGFIVMDEVWISCINLFTFTRFYHHESCGQCSPCREGTGWMEKILHKILRWSWYNGRYRFIVGYSGKNRRKHDLSAWRCSSMACGQCYPAFPFRI